MLVNLHVKNLALIEEAEIEFTRGLNILSGETGAGKSILLGAMNMALGGKVQKEMLRGNEKEALVDVVFQVTDTQQKKQLQKLDVEVYDDEIILTRRITDTRSVAKINGESVPAMKMKQVGDILLDIHGQHEHQSLLDKKKHMELLDEYGRQELEQVKSDLRQCFRQYTDKKKELDASAMDESQRIRELEFLSHEVEEIEGARLAPGEDEVLEEEYRKLSNGQRIVESLNEAYAMTNAMDGASDQIGRGIRALSTSQEYDEQVNTLLMTLTDVDNLLSDFNRDLSEYIDRNEYDGTRLQETEERLNEVNRLKAKYGNTIEAIWQSLEEKQQRLAQLEEYDTYVNDLKLQVAQLEAKVQKFSEQLSGMRQRLALNLSQQVTDALCDLNFLDVQFAMEFQRLDHYTAEGYDDAQFMISTNPGEPMKPLSKIASGGEMSRIMLAIKTVLAENDAIDTLIFDEIDSGISGRTAQAVSEKMSVVSRNHQVICITHLPQIAAMADSHYLIEKAVKNQGTISNIRKLSYAESVDELARMLGGTAITEAVLNNAREMKELAETTKKQ